MVFGVGMRILVDGDIAQGIEIGGKSMIGLMMIGVTRDVRYRCLQLVEPISYNLVVIVLITHKYYGVGLPVSEFRRGIIVIISL